MIQFLATPTKIRNSPDKNRENGLNASINGQIITVALTLSIYVIYGKIFHDYETSVPLLQREPDNGST